MARPFRIGGWKSLGKSFTAKRRQQYNGTGNAEAFAAMNRSELAAYCSEVLEREFCLDKVDPELISLIYNKRFLHRA